MQSWYKSTTLRSEVREGRSLNPDEFAIALEQVVTGTAPSDYNDPGQFFARTYFTRALSANVGIALRRLSGRTQNSGPVYTLVTQFGGGKTHALTSLYHLVTLGDAASGLPGVGSLISREGLNTVPTARVGVFVGNAWDPVDGCETPWIDLARQVAGDAGVAALGGAARTTPPGTATLRRMFATADAPILLLLDEVLNFMNRHRNMAESFYAFIQNLTVAVTATNCAVAVISLPRSQIEMTDYDQVWQDRIRKVVGRVARDLIANDQAEISEVVRRRLFEDLGSPRIQNAVANAYTNWCMDRTERLPPEWLAVDTATTETKAKRFLRDQFRACYPFHPATLSVFQRKWRALPQFQQTRGALAMLAQWVSWAAGEHFRTARAEPLITLGSAPIGVPEFRAVVLGQMGEPRLDAAIEADLVGEQAHARTLDTEAKGPLRDIHRRTGTAIFFESSGGQVDKVAHLPELRFALGGPQVDTATIDNAAHALASVAFFVRKTGTDGYRVHHQATLRKVVNDRRASLDEDADITPAVLRVVKSEFAKGVKLPLLPFPKAPTDIPDTSCLSLVVCRPEMEWIEQGDAHRKIAEWTRRRGESNRLYPAALVWCVKNPGRQLQDKVEILLAWRRVATEVEQGTLGTDFTYSDRMELRRRVAESEQDAKDEVWASYRFVVLSDNNDESGVKAIDLGAGHSSGSQTLCGRVRNTLKAHALLNESVGAGYIERHWPPAFVDAGAWPLESLLQSFLNGALTRLIDPEAVLRRQIAVLVEAGDFGLASGSLDGGYHRIWYKQPVPQEEIEFDSGVFLLTKKTAECINNGTKLDPQPPVGPDGGHQQVMPGPEPSPPSPSEGANALVRVQGTIPAEVWNMLGTRVLSKMRRLDDDIAVEIRLSATVSTQTIQALQKEVWQALKNLDLDQRLQVHVETFSEPQIPNSIKT